MINAFVPTPALEIREETPVSQAFGDVYFSRGGGVAETSHVFLSGNGLPERWMHSLSTNGGCVAQASRAVAGVSERRERRGQGPLQQHFTIAELGFGTGLNFLVTHKQFRETVPEGMTLYYRAVEKFPFTREQLQMLLALQPEVACEAAELLAIYPLRLPGPHRMVFDRAVLDLWFGEVGEWISTLQDIDAWYLDGFAPAKNPDMWSEAVFTRMRAASREGASFATFTAASAVRRGLEAAGFDVVKVPGFGRKREMLRGIVSHESLVVSKKTNDSRLTTHSVLILGAGIAGASLARALAERGYQVTVIEREVVADGASGNRAGVLFPPLTKRWSVNSAFYFLAYDWGLRTFARWKNEGLDFASGSPGMLRLPRHDDDAAMLSAIRETLGLDPTIVRSICREEASAIAGVVLATGGAYFPQGTWVSPPQLCRALLQHENIILRENTPATALERTHPGWRVVLQNGEMLEAPHLCVAAAQESATLLQGYGVKLQAVGGQVSEFAAQHVASPLRSILCRKGYVIPLGDGYLTGATYHRDALQTVTPARHAENIAELNALLPHWFQGEVTAGRSSVRATTPDRMPYIGQLDEGLYISTGHGSRGLLSGPLAAEIIASHIAGEASPVTDVMEAAVCPRRFAG